MRPPLRPTIRTLTLTLPSRPHTTASTPPPPRHLLTISDLTPTELTTLIRNATARKQSIKSGSRPMRASTPLAGHTIALTFSKRSTRTRVSLEGAIVALGGHPMFLSSSDIQLGVNESLRDTSTVLSRMSSATIARVGPHADITTLAQHSHTPVINALSSSSHPLQALADCQTLHEAFPSTHPTDLSLSGLKLAWIGDANNVLHDLAVAGVKLGLHVAVATPPSHALPPFTLAAIAAATRSTPAPGKLSTTLVPEEAVRDADVVMTDTWVSMGQEAERAQRVAAFAGFRVTEALARRGGAREGWRFMHCLPRHQEEVCDEVFYGGRSLVFDEAENRLWSVIEVLDAFVVRKGVVW